MHAAVDVLHHLVSAPPRLTREAPAYARGVYGLVDHDGQLSYIGSTERAAESFYKRIHLRHRTGSETHSHYFSKVYNTGRMWRDRMAQREHPDARIAKRFRNAFIAAHCRAVWFALDPREQDIARLERDVIRLAPPRARLWNASTQLAYAEPADLVDALMAELTTSPEERAAMERQRKRFEMRPRSDS